MSAEESVGDEKPTIYVDDQRIEGATGARMTAAEILSFAGKDPGEYALFADGHRGQRIPDQAAVPLQDGARFITVPREDADHDL